MKKTIRRILIANRGEIALRIIRTCREMGIETIAVYSEADRYAPHTRAADESYLIGPPPATLSYLNQQKILEVAKSARVDAIHPGYGFLSENPEFASRTIQEGIIFIGPDPDAMRLLGDKTAARRLATRIGVPILEGTVEPIKSVEQAGEVAKKIGYPILLKAAGGGGGKGMRIVRTDEELPGAFRGAQSEAQSAFDDNRVYIEKYLDAPRHIEIQILADQLGNVIHLGERECSIQRRHQKIIEESPSVVITEQIRKKMGEAAVSLVKASGYSNAGTVEFLLDKEKKFYFLEVNTRLQVEHPVTEMRTGLDLVREQIRIAQGEELSLRQSTVKLSGHSIECRIYAEDPSNNFFPATGTIKYLRSASGRGVREDSGIEEGIEVSTYYDPLLSKVVTWGESRMVAMERMMYTLNNYKLYGIKNNILLCLWIMNHPDFRAGNFNTKFLESNLFDISQSKDSIDLVNLAVAVSALNEETLNHEDHSSKREEGSKWKQKRLEYYQ